jgi:type VI secretion system VasI family protein
VKRPWLSIVPLLLLAFSAAADVQKELSTCANIVGEKKRLDCYDTLVRREIGGKSDVVYVRVRQNLKSEWSVSVHHFDDSRRDVYMRLPSQDLWVKSNEKTDINQFAELRPTLGIQCVNRRTAAFIDWGLFLEAQRMEVFFKVDNHPVEKRYLKVDATRERIGQWRDEVIVENLKGLLKAKKVSMRLVPKGGQPLIVRFKTDGLEKAILPLRRACGW